MSCLEIVFNTISILVLLATAFTIGWQAWETRKSAKFLEYQTRPSAYPLLLRNIKQQKTYLFVRNDSVNRILFNLRVLKEGKIIQDFRSKPLSVGNIPGCMQYPKALLDLDNYLETLSEDSEEVFTIEYKIALVSAPQHEYTDYCPEEWTIRGGKWIGPDGIEPEAIESLIHSLGARDASF